MTRHFRSWAVVPALFALCGSCGSVKTSHVAVEASPTTIRLTNGSAELVVVPESGRIMRYGFVGGANALWYDPTGASIGGWRNFGGSKVWVWPQSEWKAVCGNEWPPPGDPASAAFVAALIENGIRLTGPTIAGFGLRVVRDIVLAPSGTDVILTERLEVVGDGPHAKAGAWSIAQVAAENEIVVHGHAIDSAGLSDLPPAATTPVGDGLRLVRTSESGKSFFDATQIETRAADGTLFTITLDRHTGPSHKGQCQVYIEGTGPQPKITRTRYAELEFTAPPSPDGSNLVLHWSLKRSPVKR